VDSRLHGNDKKQISVLIDVHLRLSVVIRPFVYAQGMLIGNKHVWKNKANLTASKSV